MTQPHGGTDDGPDRDAPAADGRAVGPGAWLARHRWLVIGIWVVAGLSLLIIASVVPHQARNSFSVPGSGSADALTVLEESYPDLANPIVTVVYATADGTIESDDNAALVDATVTRLAAVDGASNVTNPTTVPFRLTNVSGDGTIAYSTMTFSESFAELPDDTFDALEAAVAPAVAAGLDVELAGALVDADNPPRSTLSQYADEISVVLAILIVLIAFGSPIVALLPIVTALASLSVSLSVLALMETVFNVGSVNEVLGTMLALGVGVDYSLLIVHRYRQLRAEGNEIDQAIARAWKSAGTSVMFAGTTICATTLGLVVVGVPFISLLALTTAMFVAFTVVSALTLLPALLGAFGDRIAWASLPWGRTVHPSESGMWARWADLNARHRVAMVVVPVLVLLAVALPVRSADLGIIDDGALPSDMTQKRAFDLLTEGFGPGENAPLLVVASLPGTGDAAPAVASLYETMQQTDGIESVSPPNLSDSRDAVLFRVVPTTGPDDEATSTLVEDLRSTVLPGAVAGSAISPDVVYVGGETATFIDFTNQISERLPAYILVGMGIAFLALMIAFRSLIVPLKAMLLALLSFLVAYGAVVAVFQWGWLKDLVGLDETVPIESFFPVILFAILIGLTLDYEVFIVSRIREEYIGRDDPNAAVIEGLRTTGKVVLSAGLIMGTVFLVFVTNPSPVIKMVGFGLGVGVLTDAILVRLLVVPAMLHILRRAAWYYPRALDRITPHVHGH